MCENTATRVEQREEALPVVYTETLQLEELSRKKKLLLVIYREILLLEKQSRKQKYCY
jgi:hypothetical protein